MGETPAARRERKIKSFAEQVKNLQRRYQDARMRWCEHCRVHHDGISDPYEVPEAPELRIDAGACSPEEAVQQVLLKLEAMGLVRPAR